ncbi:MAG: LytTR family DNA-binding domain-containing protein [Candidatus Nanopelagicales bacterium]|jgi:DNA-binding LytR/AlgR family response regulator|nr:LytTR family DNA-binding domain-containing protein [Candidatus Nanopelagicales bacterium]
MAEGLIVVAVDDEEPALAELTYLLTRTPGIAQVRPASTATDALELLHADDVDAVFLDIRMPGMDGLALARVIGRFATPLPVVFVTAYDSHAVDAFDIAAVDYLLKPIRAERLAQAVARVQRQRESEELEAPEVVPDETIAVELGGITRYVKRSDIVYVEAQRDYVRLHTRETGHLVRVPLASLEERWQGAGFLRVHRRYLVNVGFVEGLRNVGGRMTVDLGHGQAVPVSRRFSAAVKEALVAGRRLEDEP